MIETLSQFDTALFSAINGDMGNPVFDFIMPLLRNRFFWIPLYLFIIVFCIWKYKKQGFYIILGILISFALGDMISAKAIKPNVQRLRPCNEVNLSSTIVKRVPCGTGYSFPSSHATNHFAIAVFLIGVFYRKWKAILPIGIIWAASICFAQIYVGVHYPLDTLAGAVLGTIIGLLNYLAYRKLQHKL
ncbi:MAG: phosphatase PAP2 family protein [Pedobacter sp.]|nr:MAG: phosphatase PAP2 family protein [Pedobacter sp.]